MIKTPTILYIDDDLSSLLLLREQLRGTDINIITENIGKVGYNTYIETKDDIDLIILDVNLPNVNGYDLLLNIRNENDKIPIIMVTSTKFIENIDIVLTLGATEYLIKPISQKMILEIVKKYL